MKKGRTSLVDDNTNNGGEVPQRRRLEATLSLLFPRSALLIL